MQLFKKKIKTDLNSFCQQYYDKYFLELNLSNKELVGFSNHYNEIVLKKIIEIDSDFSKINFDKFCKEILIIRFEIFSLAWFHQFGIKSSILQSLYTKDYLSKTSKIDYWDGTESYNQAIAQSTIHGCSSDTASGRARIAFVMKMRMDLFAKYLKENLDEICLTRALNRFGTSSNTRPMSITLGYIAICLNNNLNCKVNEEALSYVTEIFNGFYIGVSESLEKIKLIS